MLLCAWAAETRWRSRSNAIEPMSKRIGTDNKFSKRAAILRRVLDFINNGEYEDREDFIVFGSRELRRFLSRRSPYSEEQKAKLRSVTKAMRESHADLMTEIGRRLAVDRTGLNETPSRTQLRGLRHLSRFEEFVEPIRSQALPKTALTDANHIDLVDAHCTNELLRKLPRVVRRACLLEKLEVREIPNPEVQRYFAEAHRCYLYGFQIACAVLCRAIVEAALKEKLDPNAVIERDCARTKDSYFGTLIQEAAKQKLLKDDRPEGARSVKRAGDLAVHDLSKFNERYGSDNLSDIVLHTRRVLLDLYGVET